MNNTMRNLTLSAAALAALTVIAPKATAQEHARGGGRGNAPQYQQQGSRSFRGNERHEGGRGAYRGNRGYGNYGYRYVAPVRHVARYGYRYAAPFRVFSGIRFYAACPGPGYVSIANYGWVLPPFLGAVWIPGHYDIGGFWVEGFWR